MDKECLFSSAGCFERSSNVDDGDNYRMWAVYAICELQMDIYFGRGRNVSGASLNGLWRNLSDCNYSSVLLSKLNELIRRTTLLGTQPRAEQVRWKISCPDNPILASYPTRTTDCQRNDRKGMLNKESIGVRVSFIETKRQATGWLLS